MKTIPTIVTQDILNAIAELDEFKGEWRLYSKLTADRRTALQKAALIKTVAIHMEAIGYTVAHARVTQIMNQLNTDYFKAEVDQVIAGYLFVSQEVQAHAAQIPFSQSSILQLHRWLCRYHTTIKETAGHYKQRPNHITAAGDDGDIVCMLAQTVLPYQTQEAMDNLVYATQDLYAHKQHHPLQVIGHFIGQILLIQPFDYHNHLLVPILMQLMLLHHGYTYISFGAVEPLHADTELLYTLLNRAYAQKGSSDQAINRWIHYFLQRLVIHKRKVQEKVAREQSLQLHVSDYAARLLGLIEEHGKLSVSDLVRLTGFNKNTTKKHVQELVKKQQIIMHGKARATWYTVL